MSAFADLVAFIPTAGGTTDWTFSTAVGGCQSPSAAGAQNGVSYKVYAVSSDLTQWETSTGLYNSTLGVFARTTVLYNSSGTGTATGQSGAGTKISFTAAPQVRVVALAEDLVSVEVPQTFTSAQQAQACTNIGAVFKQPAAVTLTVNPTTGSDSSNGSTPFQTLNGAASFAYRNVYTANNGLTIDGGGFTYQELVKVFFPLNGGGSLIFQNFTWKPANSSYCLQHGDGALVGLTNVILSSAGTTTPKGFTLAHNHGVLDVNGGISLNPTVNLTGAAFDNEGSGDTHININNGITINAGSMGFLYNASAPKMNFNINGVHALNGPLTLQRFAFVSLGSVLKLNGNVSFVTSGSISVSAALVNQNGVIQNLSGTTLPGGTPIPTTGGQYNTSITA